jgi:hypothetical protein
MNIFVDVQGGQLLVNASSLTPLGALKLGATMIDSACTLTLLARTGIATAPVTPQTIPAGYSQLVLAARAVDDLGSDGAPAVAITTAAASNPCLITTGTPHGLVTGQSVTIAGLTGSTPAIGGAYLATVESPTTFSIPVNCTVAGAGGTAAPGGSPPLFDCTSFSSSGSGTTQCYVGALSLNLLALIAAMVGQHTLACYLDLWVQNEDASAKFPLVLSASVVVYSAMWQGVEVAPTGPNPQFLSARFVPTCMPSLTALTGDTGSTLDGLATASGQAPLVVILFIAGAPRLWELATSPAMVSASVASDTLITTATPHGLSPGQSVIIGGMTGLSTPDISGAQTVLAVPSATTFTLAVNVTVAGSGGRVTPASNPGGGIVLPADFNAASNAQFWRSMF